MRFYLGTDRPHWLRDMGIPLFVSRRSLGRLKTPPVAIERWALDSGGFTELSMLGRWDTTVAQYIADVVRYRDHTGLLDWAAPQDWMCEPFIVAKTGLTVAEHQARTVGNFLDLRAALGPLVVPVVQGWTLADYERCCDLYAAAGVDLAYEATVGIGSVCRRQDTNEIGSILDAMNERSIRCHGFGVKSQGLVRYGDQLASADSMAWSFNGRRNGTCDHKSRCAHCRHFALDWRDKVLSARPRPRQLTLGVT